MHLVLSKEGLQWSFSIFQTLVNPKSKYFIVETTEIVFIIF